MFNRDDVRVLKGKTIWIRTGCGKLYITMNYYNNKLIEVFFNLGKSGGCASGNLQAMGRLISLGLQNGVDISFIIKQLSNIKCPRAGFDSVFEKNDSCIDAIAKVLSNSEKIDISINNVKKDDIIEKSENYNVLESGNPINFVCEICGSSGLVFEGRCYTCKSCGFSKCG